MTKELDQKAIENNSIDVEKLNEAIVLVDKYGIQPLFNYKKQTLPAVSYAGIIPFSKSNFTEEPLPFVPVNHYRNKNRREWSFEEREKLLEEVFGGAFVHPVGTKIYIELIPEVEQVNLLTQVSHGLEEEWDMGRIIAMGENTWDHLKYPMGARATLNDYVIYNKTGTQKKTLRNGVVVISAEDWNVIGTVEDPIKLMEA